MRKNTEIKLVGQPILSQLLQLVDKGSFKDLVKKKKSDYYLLLSEINFKTRVAIRPPFLNFAATKQPKLIWTKVTIMSDSRYLPKCFL